jgi:hypothetical protein
MTFKGLLRKLRHKHYGDSTRAMAHALDIDPSRISRGTPFDVHGCLRLAQLTGENPSVVLRAANKGHIATLIEALYGAGKTLLTPDEHAILEAFNALPRPESRRALIQIARDAAFGTGGQGTQGGESSGDPGALPPLTSKGPDYKMSQLFQRRARTR